MLVKIAWSICAIYGVLLVAGYTLQRKLLYVVDPRRVTPAAAGLVGVSELEIAAPDGARVVAWFGPARPGQPTLLYFHGNGGSLAARTPRIERFMAEGWGVLMMTYRGYDGSTGKPTETDNIADAIRTYDKLVALGVSARDIVLYGESLGTGVAARVAMERPSAGVVLDAPYTSIPDVGAAHYWFMPVHLLASDRYDTRSIIDKIDTPLLILHGVRDATIPVAMGRELARIAKQPKTLVEIPRGGHSDLYVNGNDALQYVRAFVRGLPRS